MKLTYDAEADALYFELRDLPTSVSIDIEEGVVADIGEDGHIIGLEVLDASKRLSVEELSTISYEDLVSERVEKITLKGLQAAKKARRRVS